MLKETGDGVLGNKPRVLIFVPSTNRDKQLELLIESCNFEFCIVAIESSSNALQDYCSNRRLKIHTLRHSRNLLQIIKNITWFTFFVSKFTPIMIESHSIIPGLYVSTVRLLGLIKHTPKISLVNFRHHNLNHHIMRRKLARRVDKFIFSNHDKTIVPSTSTFSVLLAEGCPLNKLGIIPHQLNYQRIQSTVDSCLPKYSSSSNRLELIAVGRFDWQKNYSLMLSTLAKFKETNQNFLLRIFGSGSLSEREKLSQLIRENRLIDEVHICDWTSDIETEIFRSDVFLHTALDESFGLVLAESLALGTPVVSNWMGGARDLVYFSSVPSSSNDYLEISSSLSYVFTNLKHIAEQSKRRRDDFTIFLNSRNLEELHKNLFVRVTS